MPRTAGNTREKILSAAKNQLLNHPAEEFSMREIAKACGISAGTIYNHFPDKDSLLAMIVVEDWHAALKQMDAAAEEAESLSQGLKGIFEALCSFVNQYRNMWLEYGMPQGFGSMRTKRHNELVKEIASCIRVLLVRFGPDENLDRILSECVLAAAVQEDIGLDDILRLTACIEEKR